MKSINLYFLLFFYSYNTILFSSSINNSLATSYSFQDIRTISHSSFLLCAHSNRFISHLIGLASSYLSVEGFAKPKLLPKILKTKTFWSLTGIFVFLEIFKRNCRSRENYTVAISEVYEEEKNIRNGQIKRINKVKPCSTEQLLKLIRSYNFVILSGDAGLGKSKIIDEYKKFYSLSPLEIIDFKPSENLSQARNLLSTGSVQMQNLLEPSPYFSTTIFIDDMLKKYELPALLKKFKFNSDRLVITTNEEMKFTDIEERFDLQLLGGQKTLIIKFSYGALIKDLMSKTTLKKMDEDKQKQIKDRLLEVYKRNLSACTYNNVFGLYKIMLKKAETNNEILSVDELQNILGFFSK